MYDMLYLDDRYDDAYAADLVARLTAETKSTANIALIVDCLLRNIEEIEHENLCEDPDHYEGAGAALRYTDAQIYAEALEEIARYEHN